MIHSRSANDVYSIDLSLILHTQDNVSNHEYRFAGGQCSSRLNHLLCLRLLVFAMLPETVTITSVSPYTKGRCTKHLGVLWYVACGRWRLSPPEHYKASPHSSINQEFKAIKVGQAAIISLKESNVLCHTWADTYCSSFVQDMLEREVTLQQ